MDVFKILKISANDFWMKTTDILTLLTLLGGDVLVRVPLSL